jgi:hypothetical protein
MITIAKSSSLIFLTMSPFILLSSLFSYMANFAIAKQITPCVTIFYFCTICTCFTLSFSKKAQKCVFDTSYPLMNLLYNSCDSLVLFFLFYSFLFQIFLLHLKRFVFLYNFYYSFLNVQINLHFCFYPAIILHVSNYYLLFLSFILQRYVDMI